MSTFLASLSDAIAEHARAAQPLTIGLEWGTRQMISAVLWADGVIITSEQSLPEIETATAILPGGARVPATPAGRDRGTNITALRLDAVAPPIERAPAEAVGSLVLALGADGIGGVRARLGIIETLGASWQSQCGGRIDQLIRLDMRLGKTTEGGPVIDARGRLLGMSTFGPHQQVLVIPAATIDRGVAQLLAHGQIARGWLGAGVQPVQLPREAPSEVTQTVGLMVLSIADNSPACGQLLTGDILIAAGDVALTQPCALIGLLGQDSIGVTLTFHLLRGGTFTTKHVTIAARPA
jgi:S1-C subfamily serine protease